ncbi:MAG: T9SS type A sorting domain-containing protein, partial [Bacteroidota bacterium]
QIGTAITVLPSGDFFLGGEYESGVGGLDLDPSADSALIYSNSPGSDLFVGKYTADGAYLEGWGVRGTQPDYLVDMDAGGDELVIGGYFTSFLLVDQQGGDLRFGKGAEDGYIIKYAPESTPIESSLNPMEVQLFPNPAREAVSLKFELSKAQIMDIGLYDQAGKRVQLIQQGYWMQPGPYELEIRLRADLVPGMYVLRLQTAQGQVAKKILLQ